jgi:hypothetical protein
LVSVVNEKDTEKVIDISNELNLAGKVIGKVV